MHYYKFHISDFNNSTRHLDRLSRGIYRDLIDLYYDSESPIPDDIELVCRKILAKTKKEKKAVEKVLNEFFKLNQGFFEKNRIEKDLKAYRDMCLSNKRASAISASRWPHDGPHDGPHDASLTNNHKPITKNHKPITKNQEKTKTRGRGRVRSISTLKSDLDFSIWPKGGSQEVIDEWLRYRAGRKLSVNQTVINIVGKQLLLAQGDGFSVDEVLGEAITRNWQGIKADWMKPSGNKPDAPNPLPMDVESQMKRHEERRKMRREGVFDLEEQQRRLVAMHARRSM